MQEIYEGYLLLTAADDKNISRRSFYKISSAITHGDQKLLKAVDSVTGMLVKIPVDTLQDIIDDFATSRARKEDHSVRGELVRKFLKVQYNLHTEKENESVETHSVRYGLDKPGVEQERAEKGKACDFLPHLISDLRAEITESDQSVAGAAPAKTATVVEDALHVL